MRAFCLLCIALLCLMPAVSNANEDINLECVESHYLDYAKKREAYWLAVGEEFKKQSPELYNEFNYFMTEQNNVMKMNLITLGYLLKNGSDELKTDGNLSNFVPMYTHYFEPHFRALRKIEAYSKLYQENDGYKHNNKMPDFEQLQKASALIAGPVETAESVITIRNDAMKAGNTKIAELKCQ